MDFIVADTFTASLARLTVTEQQASSTAVFTLLSNPANPGIRLHKLERIRDKNFLSARVSRDVRLILHRTASRMVLCYVDHHDDAYRWAERRLLEEHPATGAMQLVEIRETIRDIEIPRYVEVEREAPGEPKKLPFASLSEDVLLSYGVPVDWLNDVMAVDEDAFLELALHLPAEAAEALLQIAAGNQPTPSPQTGESADPFAHPDAQRRFRVMTNVEELRRALHYPWEQWTVFLHPAQQAMVERHFNGPARVSGSAGTGKTVVALHRAAHLTRTHPDARVLLTTFSDALANALKVKLGRLTAGEPEVSGRIAINTVDQVATQLHEQALDPPKMAHPSTIRSLILDASESGPSHRFTDRFLEAEWHEVVDAWQLDSWDAYRDVARLGRKTRLGENQRAILWSIYDRVRNRLRTEGLVTQPEVFTRVAERVSAVGEAPFDFIIVDESQDISVPQLRFLAALRGNAPNGLFFAGDLGQRIFQTPFSWRSLGVDVRGRSSTLRINYRTSHQIRRQADRLLPPDLSDVDGNSEVRSGTVSVFNGTEPTIRILDSTEEETTAVAEWLTEMQQEGIEAKEIGMFVRTPEQIDRAARAANAAGLKSERIGQSMEISDGHVGIGTMHAAKGLEFRAIAVIACDDDVIPLESRLMQITDDADLEDVYNTERHLLYVACTRARDHLLVTAVEPGSEFLDDLTA